MEKKDFPKGTKERAGVARSAQIIPAVKHISMDTLARICETLNCEITDVIELVSDEPASTGGKLSISVTISFAYFCPIAVVAPSATPSVLSGINRIQRWSQSKPLYLVFLLSSCQYIVFLWKGRGDIRNKHPFGHEAGCSPLPGSVNSGTRK